MAEFAEVWENWQRMCEYETKKGRCTDGHCPLVNLECNCEYPKDQKYYNGSTIEAIVMTWAAEHPKLVYPTWEQYLVDLMTADMMANKTDNPNSVENYMRKTNIPADVAEKLGIEPNEGV